MSLTAQAHLGSLLRYFQRGDFNTFCKICELAFGSESASKPFFCVDVLLAAEICGLCEVDYEKGRPQWWNAHDQDIAIRSSKPKSVGVSTHWLEAHADEAIPLITRSDGEALILGCLAQSAPAPSRRGLFFSDLPSLLPPFRQLERQVCGECSFEEHDRGGVEVYSRSARSWKKRPLSALTGSRLIRVAREYGGRAYYIHDADLGRRLSITHPEWAFVAAFHLLCWDLPDLFSLEPETVTVHRAVRLPTLVYRLLFAASRAVQIGAQVRFEGLERQAIQGLVNYFSRGGVN